MKTRDSLCGLENLIDNISFEKNPNVERASKAMTSADLELCPLGMSYGYSIGIDEDNGYVVIFIKLSDLMKLGEEKLNKYYQIVRKKFAEANFEILHEGDIDRDVYFHVGFASHNYILKNLV